MPDSTRPSPKLVISALILVQILFGLNYVISKVVVHAFPPLVWAQLRAGISALCLVSIAFASKRPFPKDGRKFFIPLIGLSLLGVVINQCSFLIGLNYTTATNSAVLNTLIPVFTLLIVVIRGQEKLTPIRTLGFAMAFAGVLIIRKIENLTFSDHTWIGDLLMIVNCLSYACFLSFGRQFIEKHDRLWTTAWLFVYGSVVISVLSIPQWSGFQAPVFTPQLGWCMAFAIFGGTLTTYFLNNWALAYTKSSSVAIFIYLQPVVASVLAYFVLGEIVSLRTVLACVLIFLGVVLVIRTTAKA